MTNYTFTVLGLLLSMVLLDTLLKTKLLFSIKFWVLLLFAGGMTIVFDTYAIHTIWQFTTEKTLGIYIINSPLENILFGISIIGINTILYEYFYPKT